MSRQSTQAQVLSTTGRRGCSACGRVPLPGLGKVAVTVIDDDLGVSRRAADSGRVLPGSSAEVTPWDVWASCSGSDGPGWASVPGRHSCSSCACCQWVAARRPRRCPTTGLLQLPAAAGPEGNVRGSNCTLIGAADAIGQAARPSAANGSPPASDQAYVRPRPRWRPSPDEGGVSTSVAAHCRHRSRLGTRQRRLRSPRAARGGSCRSRSVRARRRGAGMAAPTRRRCRTCCSQPD